MSQADNDLSEYEKLRLANIRKNAQFMLEKLGISTESTGTGKNLVAIQAEREAIKEAKATQSRKRVKVESDSDRWPAGTRRSSRISAVKYEDEIVSSPKHKKPQVEDDTTQYEEDDRSYWPQVVLKNTMFAASKIKQRFVFSIYVLKEPQQLDDFEFEIYVKLRRWRLLLARELDVETYKIFQNRTLCEAIRRRKEDPFWANAPEPSSVAGVTSPGGGNVKGQSSFTPSVILSPTATTESLLSNDASVNPVMKLKTEPKTENHPGAAVAAVAPSTGTVAATAASVTDSEQLTDVVDPVKYSPEVAKDLRACWGIGPAKVAVDGFGWGLLTELRRPSIQQLFVESRLLPVPVPCA
jgi:hypothetical protein